MISNDQTANDMPLNTLGEEQAAAWARFYAVEVNSRPGELEYDRALAAAKRLDTAVVKIVAAGGGRPKGDWPF
jgi:broad specificity phosphatase PhoE